MASLQPVPLRKVLREYLMTLVGTMIYALSMHMFTVPSQLAPGGLSGLSIIINQLWGFPVGVLYLVLNIPILFWGWKQLGMRFIYKTLLSVAMTTLLLDVLYVPLPTLNDDRLLGALLGGALSGLGLAIIFMNGGSSGGTDVTSRIITKRYPYLKIGQIILATNAVVVLAAALVFKNLHTGLYSAVSMIVSSYMLNAVMYGLEKGKVLLITTDFCDAIAQSIREKTGHTATMLFGQGCYSKAEKNTLLCAVRSNEFYRIKEIVYAIDPLAFIIIADATEIVGKGFKPMDSIKNK